MKSAVSEWDTSCLQEWAKNTMAGRLSKSDKLCAVDHSTIDYPAFRRNFYIEVQELQKMSEEDVAKYRKELDDIKVCLTLCYASCRHSHVLKCSHCRQTSGVARSCNRFQYVAASMASWYLGEAQGRLAWVLPLSYQL